MTTSSGLGNDLSAIATIRRVGIDHYADVRYLHANSLFVQSTDALTDAEIAAFTALVYSPAYSDMLAAEETFGAWINGELVGTAAWQANDDDGSTARVSSVFVLPLFTRLGIGRLLVGEVEMRARQSGFGQFAVSATANAVPFFERLGYQIASRGIRILSPQCSLPVAFMRKSALHLARPSPATVA